MTEEEKKYQDQLQEDGIEVEGVEESTDEAKAAEEAKVAEEAEAVKVAEEAKAAEEAGDEDDDDEEDDSKKIINKEEKKPRRSIYTEFKSKKKDLKEEKERSGALEKERDELASKLKVLEEAGTTEEKEDAAGDVEAFLAKHKDWNKEAIEDFIKMARKDQKVEIPDEIKQDLKEFKEWKANNAEEVEKNQFEGNFKVVAPSIKKDFPTATEKEIESIKSRLNELYHTKGWNDKDLDYIVFKHKDELSKLVSPKKKGLEGNDKIETDDVEGKTEFNPNADITKMSPKELEAWEKEYNKYSKSEGLIEDGDGRKIIL